MFVSFVIRQKISMKTLFLRKSSSIIAILIVVTTSLSIVLLIIDSSSRKISTLIDLKTPVVPIEKATRICCAILTSPKNFLTRAKAVHQTWGPRCDRHYFVSELPEKGMTKDEIFMSKQLPIAPYKNITGGYRHLTEKSTLAFLFAYEQHRNNCDWFVKADDDTYLIVDNLRSFLSEQNSSEPVTFGYNLKVYVQKGYHSGGAAYVLSQESLRRFYQAQLSPKKPCLKDGGHEDIETSKCLRSQGVYPGKSLDQYDRELFHPLPFVFHYNGRFPRWMSSYAENPLRTGYNCCSDHSVSFHYISADDQYLMDYLLYKVRPKSSARQIPVTIVNKI